MPMSGRRGSSQYRQSSRQGIYRPRDNAGAGSQSHAIVRHHRLPTQPSCPPLDHLLRTEQTHYSLIVPGGREYSCRDGAA